MEKTKANFKAIRELLGMSQQLLADMLHVDVRSVRRWESPTATNYGVAPDDAWKILEHYSEMQKWVIDSSLEKLEEIEDDMGSEPREVSLTYWQNAEDYDKAHPGEGMYWQMANANSRLIGAILRSEGYSVNFDFPGLKALEDEQG